ncbi:MAG: hypothetical protein WD708_06750 [Kiritimatiellia bacterium]
METGILSPGLWLAAAVVLCWTPVGRVQASEMQATSAALLTLDPPRGWNAGLILEAGSRTMETPGQPIKLNTRGAMIRVGYRIQPAVHLWGEVGVSQADRRGRAGAAVHQNPEAAEGEQADHQSVSEWYEDDGDGETGLAWGMGAGVLLVDFHLRTSPVLGVRESLAFELNASYRVRRSDIPAIRRMTLVTSQQVHVPVSDRTPESEAFTWSEAQVGPMMVYRRDERVDPSRPVFSPTGYAVRGGPGYVGTRYDFGEVDLENSNNLALLIGADVRFQTGWICQLNVLWMNGSDHEFSLAIVRYF